IPGTNFQGPGTNLQILTGGWELELGRWELELGRWELEPGRWELEPGRWRLLGSRFSVAAPAPPVRSDRLSARELVVARLPVALSVPLSRPGRPARRAPPPRARRGAASGAACGRLSAGVPGGAPGGLEGPGRTGDRGVRHAPLLRLAARPPRRRGLAAHRRPHPAGGRIPARTVAACGNRRD